MSSTRSFLLLHLTIAVAILGTTGLALQLASEEPGEPSTYVGQQTCMSCHAGPYGDGSVYFGAAAFRQTLHQKIHLRPTPETVIIDRQFREGRVLRFPVQSTVAGRDTLLVKLSKGAGENDYFIGLKISGGGDSLPPMKVAYTYGGNGWMQRYLIEIGESFHVAPFQYVLKRYRERDDNTEQWHPLDLNRWMAFDSASGQMKFFEWNSRTFREKSWDKGCSSCHVNGFDIETGESNGAPYWKALWVGRKERDSALQDINISIGCESCHGPGSAHVAVPRADNIISPKRWGDSPEATMLKRDLCGNCHDRSLSSGGTFTFPYDEANRRPYIPGTPLDAYILDRFAGMATWPDRFTSYAHHQTGQDLQRAAPFAAGAFKEACTSCHLAHGQRDGLPFQLDRNWYSLDDGEGCLSCHGSNGSTTARFGDLSRTEVIDGKSINSHTRHSLEASACVNCHFPKTATIGFFSMEMSSHNFRVIPPNITRDFSTNTLTGMPNTCASECHRNGRGSRNVADTTPVAPTFGTVDNNRSLTFWRDRADLELADSLWYHYKRMYPEFVSAVRDGSAAGTVAITSVVPDPVVDRSVVRFELPRASDISLELFDIEGHRLRVLAAGRHQVGGYSVVWDRTDGIGRLVAAGTYFLRLVVDGSVVSRNIVVR